MGNSCSLFLVHLHFDSRNFIKQKREIMLTKIVELKSNNWDFKIIRPTNWSNPWSSKEDSMAKFRAESKKESLENYKKWLCGEDFTDILQAERNWILNQMSTLKGHKLGCICKIDNTKDEYQCHGQILIDLIEGKLQYGDLKEVQVAKLIKSIKKKKISAQNLF